MPSNVAIDFPNRFGAIEASLNLNIHSRQIGHMGLSPHCSGGSTTILNPPRGSQPTTPMHVYGVAPSGHMTPMEDTMRENWARMPPGQQTPPMGMSVPVQASNMMPTEDNDDSLPPLPKAFPNIRP